jgi:hypothetical protein
MRWWLSIVANACIPAHANLRQKDGEFKARLDYRDPVSKQRR